MFIKRVFVNSRVREVTLPKKLFGEEKKTKHMRSKNRCRQEPEHGTLVHTVTEVTKGMRVSQR